MSEATNKDEWITIAVIARPHGVAGEVSAEILTDFPERFLELESVGLCKSGDLLGEVRIEEAKFHQGRVLLKLAGYDTVDQAETLREARLVIPRSELFELPADNYYTFDLIGCEVVTSSGQQVGKVTAVHDYGASPLLEVKDGSHEYLIPLTHTICPDVNVANKRIVIEPPEGLLDL